MTDQTKMPDEAWLIRSPWYEWRDDKTQADYVSEVNCNGSGAAVSYTRTDLYDAVVAERDALRALCEEIAGALSLIRRELHSKSANKAFDDALAAYEKHNGVG